MHAPGAPAWSRAQAGFAGQLVEGGVDAVVGEPPATLGDEKACRGWPGAELISPGAVGAERFDGAVVAHHLPGVAVMRMSA